MSEPKASYRTSVMGRLMPIEELRAECGRLRSEGKRLVLCHGTFDVVHPGHIEHLRQAKAMGDVLVVGITSDQYVSKGPGRPVFDHNKRLQFIANLLMVDYATLVDSSSAIPIIEAVRPFVYAKGQEYKERKEQGNFPNEKALVEEYGGTVKFTEGFAASSSKIINGYIESRPQSVEKYLYELRAKYRPEEVLTWLDRLKGITALVVGEPIIDEYIYVTPAGRSSKESIVVYEQQGHESWFGGAYIVQEHMKSLGIDVTLDTCDLDPLTKRRYVEKAFSRKVFSVVDRAPTLSPVYPDRAPYDVTVVADYGHGMFPSQKACHDFRGFGEQPFLGITVQSNSLNWGFNRLTKWPQADYVVVDEEELRLACGNQNWDGQDMQYWLVHEKRRMDTKMFAVTLGHRGCMVYDGATFTEAPALASKIVDRMGAGDAFLSITAPLVKLGAPPDIVAFLGSVAAGIKVGLLGNQPVQGATVRKWVNSMISV